MAAATEKPHNADELTITERLNQLIQKNRRTLFIGLITIIVILAGFISGSVIRDKLRADALSRIEAYERRYEEIRYSAFGETEEAVVQVSGIIALLEDLNEFQRKNSGFAKARSLFLSADIYWDQQRWAEAEKTWIEAANAAKKSYLAPVSLFNAAVAAEEQGNIQPAIDHYNSALVYGDSFPGAAKAQFSIGRLEESRGNDAGAIDAYRNLLGKWPGDPFWASLAQNRIIVLQN
jgi:tetratricopeptide (TPR) repeat protein